MKHNELQIMTLKNCDLDILDHLFQIMCSYKKEVEMFADMTEGCVSILIDYPTIGTEGQLPPSTPDCQGLSHQTSMSVEVRQ